MIAFGSLAIKGMVIAIIIATAWIGAEVAHRFAGSHALARKRSASANAAAGGFLLGAGLFHFLPEAHAHFEVAYPRHDFPIGFVLCAIGFTAILTIERMLFDPEAHALEGERKTSAAPILAIALSIHALLAGFAVGSEKSTMALLTLAAALGAHKFAAAFTLGASLNRGGVSSSVFHKVILVFSLATPIGLILGSTFQEVLDDKTALLVKATFDALAAGTFLYIAALEVIHDEFFHKRANWMDMMFFMVGLVVMALLSFAE